MPRISQLPWGLAASLLALSLQVWPALASPSVEVGMVAAFPSPPYLTELLETAAQENASSYFPLLDRIAEGYFSQATTERDLYEAFLGLLQEDRHLASGEELSTFKLALSLRSAAPRVEAHFQYYRTAVAGPNDDSCVPWILWKGARYCSPELETASGRVPGHAAQEKDVAFDRTLGHGAAAILYADVTSPSFGPFHRLLADKARQGEVSYRVRHVRSAAAAGNDADGDDLAGRLPVSGYGVELALKRTDYIVIDDRDAAAGDSSGGTEAAAAAAEAVLDGEEEVTDLKALSKSEVAELGLKTADYILQSGRPLERLVQITQDFPKYSRAIAQHNVSAEFVQEHRANRQQLLGAGANVLWMNGAQLIERQIQPLALVDSVRRERRLLSGARALGLTGRETVDVLGHTAVAESKAERGPPRFDWRDDIEGGGVIIYLNDLEKDTRYAEYSPSLMMLLQGGRPGQLPPLRRDVFNQVYAVDLAQAADMQLVAEQILGFVQRKLSVRFALVPLLGGGAGSAQQAKVAYHLVETYGLATLSAYLRASLETGQTEQPATAVFDDVVEGRPLREGATRLGLAEVLAATQYEKQIERAAQWAERLGANSEVPPIFVDGAVVPRDGNWLQAMSAKLGSDLRMAQEGLYYGWLKEDGWAPGFFLRGAATKRNAYIFPEDASQLAVVDVSKLQADHADLFGQIPVVEASEETTRESWAVVTVVADLEGDAGVELLSAALQFRASHPGVRLDVVYNPNTTVTHDVTGALQALGDVDPETLRARLAEATAPAPAAYLAAVGRFLETARLQAGANAVLVNGRVVGPFAATSRFAADDFASLLAFEQKERIRPVLEAVADLNLTDKLASALAVAKLTSITALSTISALPEGIFESAPTLRITSFQAWQASHTALTVGDAATATIHLTVALDPASEQGQRWAPLLQVLSQLDGVFLRVFLNPRDRLDELPVKRFYRSVLEAAPSFDAAGRVQALAGRFRGLPSEALLNLGLEVPPAWLVAPRVSVHDLDNIKLSAVKTDVTATYELEHILIEGHSREANGQPPRGAQLVLTGEAADAAPFADTIVMANLGYFQFKANPGCYHIRLKTGRSADIFRIESVGPHGMAAVPGDEGDAVALLDFQGATLYPRLVRKPGMEAEDVLSEVAEGPLSYVAKLAEGLLGKKTATEQADINIFSVASGHLYERMLNIMMVSVMRHTRSTVKFWFIEQFLSPSFKDFIPTLAAEYGFRYEMVTYKWPHWLRQQKEKQREIWGYKILFLDVLFPLDLDKVIFVDADQIVRTDMAELVGLDLHGAPYGFTPMCDSRTEMEGFRFWKQGYWKNYLQGRPYHISALYVVDLRRFRELAAGDRLRQTYHTLSADPHSLSNLDQDLPNHMQLQIPIFSLPQDWLWCETWCSDAALSHAKTIDLCNNPETKEPKLDRARRQVPEWTVYDDEIAAVARQHRGTAQAKTEKTEKDEL